VHIKGKTLEVNNSLLKKMEKLLNIINVTW